MVHDAVWFNLKGVRRPMHVVAVRDRLLASTPPVVSSVWRTEILKPKNSHEAALVSLMKK